MKTTTEHVPPTARIDMIVLEGLTIDGWPTSVSLYPEELEFLHSIWRRVCGHLWVIDCDCELRSLDVL